MRALTQKVLNLENEITEMKNEKQPSGNIVKRSLLVSDAEKESETEKSNKWNCLIDNSNFNTSDIKENTSTPTMNKDKVKKW